MQAGEGLEAQRTATGPPTVPDESWASFCSFYVPNTVLSALREVTQLTMLGSRCSDDSHPAEDAEEIVQQLVQATEFVNGGNTPDPVFDH